MIPMHPLTSLVILISIVFTGDPPPADVALEGPPAATDVEAPPRRAIVRVNRNREVQGHIELEEDDVIVLRHLDGTVESYPKTRVLRIIHLVDPVPGQKGVVRLRNGQTSAGIVIEDGFEAVILEVEGIRVRFRREVVNEVILEPTFQERYDQFKQSLGPNMYEQHLGLCRWLINEHRYELARIELEELIRRNPDLTEARRLLEVVKAQMAMQQGTLERRQTAPPPGLPVLSDRTGPVYDADIIPNELLSHEDVNVIRVYEIDLHDPPKMNIRPDTIRDMLERYGTSPLLPANSAARTALFRAEPEEIVSVLFELRARDLYPQIEVLSEPRALNIFRQRVHNTWLVNSCATSHCHGGPKAGALFLHRQNHKNPRVRMTNFLILERLKLDPKWPLINYDAPLDSLIVQYGLPRDHARKPHPDVRGWRPVFSPGNRRLLDSTIEWIEAMMQPRPDYPVDFEPSTVGGELPPPPLDAPLNPDRTPR